ncbi:YdjY domain-containing protein [Brachyspira sp. G79]|uniref:YdjY domain-containing protein n=1 Tax=Brachyspira sp. G79 TaxID=1358104 RepID=UPI000BBBDF66|nr:YdjY domain-containing protein [Brachyspira sp. G79]
MYEQKIIIMLCLLFAFMLSSCGNKQQQSSSVSSAELTNSMGSVILRDEGAEPVVIDIEKKEVIIPAEVNAKYFNSPTRHGIVFDRGANGDKSVLRGLSDEREFYQALIDIGAVAGNNLTMEDMKLEKTVDGQKLDVFVTWDGLGKEIPFADIIRSDEERPMDIRFGGNFEAAKSKRTGCILCLDSCAVGITSDAAYETGAVEVKKIGRYGREDVLPADGTRVSVIFRIAEDNN